MALPPCKDFQACIFEFQKVTCGDFEADPLASKVLSEPKIRSGQTQYHSS
jgi:hypothetical protein